MGNFEHDALTEKVIGCCFEVHRLLGPGFIEKIYVKALIHQLTIENLSFVAEKEFNVVFKNQLVGKFRCDLFIENSVILELKSATGYIPTLFKSQKINIRRCNQLTNL